MTINASAVHVVSPNTPGARRFHTTEARISGSAGAAAHGWLDLFAQNENGTISDEVIEVEGSDAELGALFKAQQDNGALWLTFGREGDGDPVVSAPDGAAVHVAWKRPGE